MTSDVMDSKPEQSFPSYGSPATIDELRNFAETLGPPELHAAIRSRVDPEMFGQAWLLQVLSDVALAKSRTATEAEQPEIAFTFYAASRIALGFSRLRQREASEVLH